MALIEVSPTSKAAIEAALEISSVLYGGMPGGRPETDAGILRAIADVLDRCDAIADRAMASVNNEHLVGHEWQDEMRRIAAELERGAA